MCDWEPKKSVVSVRLSWGSLSSRLNEPSCRSYLRRRIPLLISHNGRELAGSTHPTWICYNLLKLQLVAAAWGSVPECVKNSLFQLACKRLVPRAGLSKPDARVGKMNMGVYKAPLLLQTIEGNLRGWMQRERLYHEGVVVGCYLSSKHYFWPAMF